MKTLRFLHIGDMHIDHDPKFKAKIQPSLDQVLQYCREIKINAVVIPGDLTHRKQSYSASSGVPMLINFLKELSQHVDFIFITKGNHDEPGSISLLHQIEPNVYAFEFPVVMGVNDGEWKTAVDILREKWRLPLKYIVSLVPYPTKASLLIEDSIDNNNAEFISKFEQIFEHIGDITESNTCPKILGFHGNVIGSRLSSGQTLVSQDIMVAPPTLEKANHNYYALNHIHAYQEINPRMFYAGGISNFNWGETEQKSFQVVTFEDGEMSVERVMLTSARPMITLNAEFKDGEFCFEDPGYALEVGMKEYEYRLKVKIKENERNLVTDDKIENIKFLYTEDVKIEWSVIPVERESRSEQIMNCRSLLDEVVEYGNITAADVFSTGTEENFLKPSLIDKVTKIVEKGVES